MTIEKIGNAGYMITGEDDILAYRMLTQIKALELEVRTGLRMSNRFNLLKSLREEHDLKSRKKVDAIVEMKELFVQRFGKDPFKD